jgi:hypothetical protein
MTFVPNNLRDLGEEEERERERERGGGVGGEAYKQSNSLN